MHCPRVQGVQGGPETQGPSRPYCKHRVTMDSPAPSMGPRLQLYKTRKEVKTSSQIRFPGATGNSMYSCTGCSLHHGVQLKDWVGAEPQSTFHSLSVCPGIGLRQPEGRGTFF